MSPVLRFRDFRFLFLIRILAAMSLQSQAVIVGWQVYQLSQDPLLLGLLGLTEALPAIGSSFFAGHWVDIYRPALVLRFSLLCLFLNTVFLLIVALPALPLADHTRLICLFIGIFISGAARSFSSPSIFSLIPSIVPREFLSAAAAWNSSSYQFASILGPALGGLLYGSFGAVIAFAAPPILLMAALGFNFFLSKTTQHLRSSSQREPFLKSLKAGIAFTLGHRVLLSTLLLDMFSVLFGGAVAILPMYSDQILHAGSTGLGFLRAAPAVGSGLTALFLAFRPLHSISGKRLLIVVAGFGVTTLFFAVSTEFHWAFVFLALSGAFDGVSMVIRSTILQLLTPDHMRGRVSALSSIFITSSNEIGAFESGLAAKLMGLVPSMIFGGSMTLAVVGVTNWVFPQLRKTEIDSSSKAK